MATIEATKTALGAPPRLMDARAVHDLLEKGSASLVDVRGVDEFIGCHVDGAVCIPLPDLERRYAEIPADHQVVVICQLGGRSASAAQRLRSLGVSDVIDVEGGMDAWLKADLPVVRTRSVMPLERQVRGIAGLLVFVFALASVFSSRWFLSVPLFVGFMLGLSSVTGLCPMLSILKAMPWNRSQQN